MLRVKRFSSRTEFTSFQLLQKKRWWGWQTIDREDIPSHAVIGLATVGDPGDWVSKFAGVGTFGSDGILVPHTVSDLYAEVRALREKVEKLSSAAIAAERAGIEAVKQAYFEGRNSVDPDADTWKPWLASKALKSLADITAPRRNH